MTIRTFHPMEHRDRAQKTRAMAHGELDNLDLANSGYVPEGNSRDAKQSRNEGYNEDIADEIRVLMRSALCSTEEMCTVSVLRVIHSLRYQALGLTL
ncbi:hypothetical protein HGRIS_001900 [Hohenbuehelia grisea]|uniref:Uncharacterized protein n=1 Tax=Hohenbuehelia grisea TaxID=104357 RepID=A0ABR3JKK3_9AGAR